MSLAYGTKCSLLLYCLNLYYCFFFLGTMGFYAPNSCVHHVYLEGIHCSRKSLEDKNLEVQDYSVGAGTFIFFCPLVSMQVTYTGTAMQTCKPCIIATFHKCCLLFQVFFSSNFQLQGNIQDTQLFYTLWSYHFSICCYFGPSLGHFPNIVYSYVSIIVTARLQAKPTQDKTMRGKKKCQPKQALCRKQSTV